MERETLEFTPEEGRNIIWGDTDDFKEISDEIVGTRRWSNDHEAVFQRISDGKFFSVSYSRGATESQDEKPFEYDKEAVFSEVFRVEKTVIVYE